MVKAEVEELVRSVKRELKDPTVTVAEALRRSGVDLNDKGAYKAAWDAINRNHVIGRRLIRKPRTQTTEVTK